jgi:uncharacterized membrane protein
MGGEMNEKTLSLLVGGLLPALCFGVAGIFQKVTARAGITTGIYLVGIGLTTALIGVVFTLWDKPTVCNFKGMAYTVAFGVCWSLATAFIAIALRRYNAQISQIIPLYNTNTLIGVLLGLFLLSECHTLSVAKLLLSTVLIIAGGLLAATA